MSASTQTPDITNLCFQEFYLGNLINGEIKEIKIIESEFIWNQIKFNYIKLSVDDCFSLKLNLLRFLYANK